MRAKIQIGDNYTLELAGRRFVAVNNNLRYEGVGDRREKSEDSLEMLIHTNITELLLEALAETEDI